MQRAGRSGLQMLDSLVSFAGQGSVCLAQGTDLTFGEGNAMNYFIVQGFNGSWWTGTILRSLADAKQACRNLIFEGGVRQARVVDTRSNGVVFSIN